MRSTALDRSSFSTANAMRQGIQNVVADIHPIARRGIEGVLNRS